MNFAKRVMNVNALCGLSALACAAILPLTASAQEPGDTEGVMARSTIKGDPNAVCGNFAYVSNSYSETLSVIDLDHNRLVKNIPTGTAPVNPTFNNDWTKLYFANVDDDSLSIVDTKTKKIVDTIPAGWSRPSGLRFLPDGKHLVISFIGPKRGEPGALGLLNLETGKLEKRVSVEAQSERFDITPDGKRAYVANILSQSVSVVDLEKFELITTIKSPEKYPFNVLISPQGDRAFVGSVMGNTLVEIDTATNKVVKTIKTAAGPNGMTFTPDGDNILITTVYAGRLQAYNRSAGVVNEGSFVGLLPGFIRLQADGLKGVFVHPYGRQVSIFDGTTMQVIENIETGVGPTTVAVCGNP